MTTLRMALPYFIANNHTHYVQMVTQKIDALRCVRGYLAMTAS